MKTLKMVHIKKKKKKPLKKKKKINTYVKNNIFFEVSGGKER